MSGFGADTFRHRRQRDPSVMRSIRVWRLMGNQLVVSGLLRTAARGCSGGLRKRKMKKKQLRDRLEKQL